MKMVIAVVQGKDAGVVSNQLVGKGFRVTRINTSGGFLRESNVTLLVGVEDDKVEKVLKIIHENCQTRTRYINPLPSMSEPGSELYLANPVEVQVGGATVFVLAVDKYLRL